MTLVRPKHVIVTAVAAIAALLVMGLLVHKIAKNRAYSLLENAVASQSFADSLNRPKHTSRECYSTEGQDYCPTISYVLTNEACKQLDVALKEAGCDDEYAQEIVTYKGEPITYRVSTFQQKKILEVYANKVSRLY
jgi:hypothetical protein